MAISFQIPVDDPIRFLNFLKIQAGVMEVYYTRLFILLQRPRSVDQQRHPRLMQPDARAASNRVDVTSFWHPRHTS